MSRVGSLSRLINTGEGDVTPKRRNASPEHTLQKSVRQFLVYCLPDDIEWTASLAGVNLPVQSASKAKAAGVRRGWPDLQFLFPDGVTRYIELKAGSVLKPEQRAFQQRCAPHGIHAVCRSLDEVERTLRSWGARLKAHPFEIAAGGPV